MPYFDFQFGFDCVSFRNAASLLVRPHRALMEPHRSMSDILQNTHTSSCRLTPTAHTAFDVLIATPADFLIFSSTEGYTFFRNQQGMLKTRREFRPAALCSESIRNNFRLPATQRIQCQSASIDRNIRKISPESGVPKIAKFIGKSSINGLAPFKSGKMINLTRVWAPRTPGGPNPISNSSTPAAQRRQSTCTINS